MKRLFAIILCFVIACSFLASCNNGSDNDVKTSPSAQPSQAAPSATPSDSGEEEQSASLAVLDGGVFKLPIIDTKAEFTLWDPWNIARSNMLSNNDSFGYQEIEKRTNIHIEWHHASVGQEQESFQLSIASGSYDDGYLTAKSFLTSGPDFYIENDIFIDIEPYIAQYAPNDDYVRNYHDVVKDTLTDAGYGIGFQQISKTLQWSYLAALGRVDWLEDLGMAMPETYDEFHDFLVAVRDTYNPVAPLSMNLSGYDDWLIAGYDTMYSTGWTGNQFIQKNGVVHFGAFEPGFKEYIQMIQSWYAEGLVDPEYFARERNPSTDNAYILNGKVGVGQCVYSRPDITATMVKNDPTIDQNLRWEGFKMPVKNKGDVRKIVVGGAQINPMKGVYNTISTACDDIETLMRWFDYFYTEEGSLIANYGIEGQGFTYDANGKPQTTELVYANEDGLNVNTMLALYATNQNLAAWYDWEREISPAAIPAVRETRDIYDSNWVDEYSINEVSITMTTEENTEFAAIMADIMTYIDENMVMFMTNQRSMDQYDGVMDQIKNMNIDRAIAIKQAAYDRYMARS